MCYCLKLLNNGGNAVKICLSDYEPKDVIRIIREWIELIQKEFGKSICKAERTLQDYEAGRSRYYIDTLYKIAEVHKIEIVITKK